MNHDAAPDGQSRRNFNLGVINGVLYILSETLLDPTLVLVAFLSNLTASPILLGLILPIRDGAWALPQLWVSGFLQSMPSKMVMYRRLSVLRIAAWGTVALAINTIRNPDVLLPAFFIAFSAGALTSGLSGLPFLEVVSKTIPARRRGGFFAWRFGLGGLLGIGGSLFVRWMLDPNGPLPYPRNFGLLAALWFGLASISLLLYNGVVEPPDLVTRARASFTSQFRRAVLFLKTDPGYRRFLVMQSSLLLGGAATPFFAIFVQQKLGGPKEMVALYLGTTTFFNLLSNILFGRISFRHGNRRVMFLAAATGITMSVIVLALAALAGPLGLSPLAASYCLVPVFALVGIRGTAIGVSGNSLLLEIAPPEDRSLYVGFTQSFMGVVLLSTSLSGVVVALLGFQTVVLVTLLAHGLALYAAWRIQRTLSGVVSSGWWVEVSIQFSVVSSQSSVLNPSLQSIVPSRSSRFSLFGPRSAPRSSAASRFSAYYSILQGKYTYRLDSIGCTFSSRGAGIFGGVIP